MDQKTGISVSPRCKSLARKGLLGRVDYGLWPCPSASEKAHESPPLYHRPVDGHRALHPIWRRGLAKRGCPLGERSLQPGHPYGLGSPRRRLLPEGGGAHALGGIRRRWRSLPRGLALDIFDHRRPERAALPPALRVTTVYQSEG